MLWLREPRGLCTFGDQICALSVSAHTHRRSLTDHRSIVSGRHFPILETGNYILHLRCGENPTLRVRSRNGRLGFVLLVAAE